MAKCDFFSRIYNDFLLFIIFVERLTVKFLFKDKAVKFNFFSGNLLTWQLQGLYNAGLMHIRVHK